MSTPASWLDNLILELDTSLKTLFPPQKRSHDRPSPATGLDEPDLSPVEHKHVPGFKLLIFNLLHF